MIVLKKLYRVSTLDWRYWSFVSVIHSCLYKRLHDYHTALVDLRNR